MSSLTNAALAAPPCAPGRDEADQEECRAAADRLRQGHEMRTECRKLRDSELETLGHQQQEPGRRAMAAGHRLGRRRKRPGGG